MVANDSSSTMVPPSLKAQHHSACSHSSTTVYSTSMDWPHNSFVGGRGGGQVGISPPINIFPHHLRAQQHFSYTPVCPLCSSVKECYKKLQVMLDQPDVSSCSSSLFPLVFYGLDPPCLQHKRKSKLLPYHPFTHSKLVSFFSF